MATYLESVEAQRKKREGQPIVRPWVEAARREWNDVMAGNPEGRRLYEQGRDAITSGLRRGAQSAFSGNPEGRQLYEQGRDAILRGPQNPFGTSTAIGSAEDVSRGVQRVKDWAGRIPATIEANARARELESMGPVARQRRLEMANYQSEAARRPNMPQEPLDNPVMAKSQTGESRPETGLRNEGPPEQAAYGVGQQPDKRTIPGRTGQAVATSSAASVSGPIAAPSSDPRKRYMDMAKMSLEQREAYLNSLPVGQRPIQVIRGNTESWYSPGMSREFATIPEAVSGIQGRPTYQSEEERAERAAGRGAVSSRQSARFAHERAMKSDEFSHEEKMAKEYGVGVRGGKGSGNIKGADGDEWKPEKFTLPDGTEAFQLFSKSGKTVTVKPNPESVGGFLINMNMKDSGTRQMALDMVMGVTDPAEQNRLFKNQPEHIQAAVLQAIKERKERETKK